MKDYPFSQNRVFDSRHGMDGDDIHRKVLVTCPVCRMKYNHTANPIVERRRPG